MEHEAATIEHDLRHAGLFGALGERLANRGSTVPGRAGLALHFLVEGRRGGNRLARQIVDDLSVDMTARTVNRQTRLTGGTRPKRRANTATAAIQEGQSGPGLLLLTFFSEDVLA